MKKRYFSVLCIGLLVLLLLNGCNATDLFGSNIDELEEDDVNLVVGSYRSDKKNILTFFDDGSMEYYLYEENKVVEDGVWRLDDNRLVWSHDDLKGDFVAWLYGYNTDELEFKRSPSNLSFKGDTFNKILSKPESRDTEEYKKIAEDTLRASNFEGKNYKKIKKKLKKYGFENVKTKKRNANTFPELDLSKIEEGDVKDVLIDGSTDYFSYMDVPKESNVVIEWYTLEDDIWDHPGWDGFAERYSQLRPGGSISLESQEIRDYSENYTYINETGLVRIVINKYTGDESGEYRYAEMGVEDNETNRTLFYNDVIYFKSIFLLV